MDSRLELALELGATHVINTGKDDPASVVSSITNGKGADYAVNATGTGKTISMVLDCLSLFGKLAAIGSGGGASFDYLGARTITGITEGWSMPREFIPQLISFYQKGLFPFDKLVKFYDFEDINIAANDALSGKTIKPVLLMGAKE